MDRLRSLIRCLVPFHHNHTKKSSKGRHSKPSEKTVKRESSLDLSWEKSTPTVHHKALQHSTSTILKPSQPSTPPNEEYLKDDDAIRTLVSTPVGSVVNATPVLPNEEPLVAVIGVGYVGSHLVSAFSPHHNIIAFDISSAQLDRVAATLTREQLKNIRWTTDPSDLANATHFLISVPTSLKSDKSIDLSFLQSAIGTVARFGRTGATVVIESSVSVGLTRRLLTPLMEARGLLAGMSPERVDPGRTEPPMELIPKIISGLDNASLASIQRLYTTVFQRVVPVTKPEVAEMMKLYENCQRMVCVAYANEMADACRPHDIDPFEVTRAAATKPFGYIPFTPGLGVGGPCIPVNPYYLLQNNEFPLLKEATERMWRRPGEIGNRAMQAVNTKSAKSGGKTRVLVVGAGFKKGQSVVAHSPSADLMRGLINNWGSDAVDVWFVDPNVQQTQLPYAKKLDEKKHWKRAELEEKFDLVIVAFVPDGVDVAVLQTLEAGGKTRVERWCQ